MAKTSVIVPARNERFLVKTIDDVFAKARGEVEVVAVLDGGPWPDDWAAVTARHPNLHTIYHAEPKGMRPSINEAVASAVSRKTKYILKSDAHCMFDEGFDEKLKADMAPNWVVVPRRKRLDAENWTLTDTHKPDIDAHYLSFPDDPADFGGPGLNGKVWAERAAKRIDVLIDTEMSSQGSCWFMEAKYFYELELMDAESYGTFWNEMQEIGLKAWLSGGQLMVNKKTWYAHLHKGKHTVAADGRTGRGYHLDERQLKQGRNHTMKWLYNEAWGRQTLPFKMLIERFWPVLGWPEDWESIVYGKDAPVRANVIGPIDEVKGIWTDTPNVIQGKLLQYVDKPSQLQIHSAAYGYDHEHKIDVLSRVRELVTNGSLDIIVNNSTLTPDQNPFRGKKKTLSVRYSFDGGEKQLLQRQEKEWLIIGQVRPQGMDAALPAVKTAADAMREFGEALNKLPMEAKAYIADEKSYPMSATALNDFLIRRFHVSDRRLRAPMPIELRDFNRNDLAKLFAELGFSMGAEIGVAEGKYSEVLLKANPSLELLLVDPWHRYAGNPQGKTKEKDEFAFSEAKRRTANYSNAQLFPGLSMDVVGEVSNNSLDFVYIDGHHGFDYVMQDLIEWSKRVRSGGIVSGDDYYHLSDRWGAGPVEAVQAYTNAHKIAIWFTCDAHKSVDFFWVKP